MFVGIDNDIRKLLDGHLTFIYIFFGLMLAAVITLKVFKLFILKRSEQGNEEYSKWIAFKRWMEDYSVTKNYPIDSLVLWQDYLIYGLALGVSKKALSELPIKYETSNEFVVLGFELTSRSGITTPYPIETWITEIVDNLIELTAFIPEMFGTDKT